MSVTRRKWKRSLDDPEHDGATGVIKIGFDGYELVEPKDRGKGKKPSKLPGFLILHNVKGADKRYLIDTDAMKRLGYSEEQIGEAKRLQLKAEHGKLLPTKLHFIIRNDAVFKDGHWDFPGTFFEQFKCQKIMEVINPVTKKKSTINLTFCRGDGYKATRKQADGSEKQVDCIPYGSTNDPSEWCEFSVRKECKDCSRLNVCLFCQDENGQMKPLSPHGLSASYRFDTTSDTNPIVFLKELEFAAGKVQGKLALIPGVLIFNTAERAYEGGQALVGNVSMIIDREELMRRERMLHQWLLEEKGYLAPKEITAEVSTPKLIDAPVTFTDAHPTPPVDDNEPITVEPDPSEDTGPDGLANDYQPTDITVEAEVGLVTPEMAEKQNGTTAANATPKQLAEALKDYLDYYTGGDPNHFKAKLNKLAFGDGKGFERDGKWTAIQSVDWFFKAPDETKHKARIDILRRICVELEAAGTDGFVIGAMGVE